MDEQKEDIEQKAQDELVKLEDDIAIERKDREASIEEVLKRSKLDRLSSFEDALKDAKSKDFGKVLDGYQEASKRVDNELDKERLKQQQELDRALKNRRGQKRAVIEKEKADQLRMVQS